LKNTYGQLFQLLHKSNQNQRILINKKDTENETHKKEKDELMRYKSLVETLERRCTADAQTMARLEAASQRDQRLISQLSSSLDAATQVQALKQTRAEMQEDIKQLSSTLAQEREVRESLCAELAGLPSKEQLFQTSSDLAFMRARATELHCAMEVVLQYMQVSHSSSTEPDSSAVTLALESALVTGLRKELEEETLDKARVAFSRDILEKNNKVLAQQVLSLLAQLGRSPAEFPVNLNSTSDELIVKGLLLFYLYFLKINILLISSDTTTFKNILHRNNCWIRANTGRANRCGTICYHRRPGALASSFQASGFSPSGTTESAGTWHASRILRQ